MAVLGFTLPPDSGEKLSLGMDFFIILFQHFRHAREKDGEKIYLLPGALHRHNLSHHYPSPDTVLHGEPSHPVHYSLVDDTSWVHFAPRVR